jgi:hypothetical protein
LIDRYTTGRGHILTRTSGPGTLGFFYKEPAEGRLNNPRSPLPHDLKPQTSRMGATNFNATTPQSEAVKNLLDAYYTSDMNNVKPFISKDFKFQTFPNINNPFDELKEGHLERSAVFFSLVTKVEVCIHTASEFAG